MRDVNYGWLIIIFTLLGASMFLWRFMPRCARALLWILQVHRVNYFGVDWWLLFFLATMGTALMVFLPWGQM